MTNSKKKAKMSAGDHGGLLLAAVPIHSSIKDRHKELTDGSLVDQAAGSLEDFSAKLEEIASMTNFFDSDAGFFDAPKEEKPTQAAAPNPGAAEEYNFAQPVTIDEDENAPVSIGGLDDGDEALFDFGAENVDLSVDLSTTLGETEGPEHPEDWDASIGVMPDDAASAFGQDIPEVEAVQMEEEIAFEVMPEAEAHENAAISDKIIKLAEQDDEFDVGEDPDLYNDEDEHFGDDEFGDDEVTLEDDTENEILKDVDHPVFSEIDDEDDEPDFDMSGSSDEGFAIQDFPESAVRSADVETEGRAESDDWGYLPTPTPEGYGNDDGTGWDSYEDQGKTSSESPEEEFFFEDTAPVRGNTSPEDGVAKNEAGWGGYETPEPQISSARTPVAKSKPVDQQERDVSGFDLSPDIETNEGTIGVAAKAAMASESRRTKTEGDAAVRDAKSRNQRDDFEDDQDAFADLSNDDELDEFANLAEDEDEAPAAAKVSAKSKRTARVSKPAAPAPKASSKKTILIASAATAALLILGGGYMALQLGNSAPVASQATPAMPTPNFAPQDASQGAQAPAQVLPVELTQEVQVQPQVDPAAQFPIASPAPQVAPINDSEEQLGVVEAQADFDLFAELGEIEAPTPQVDELQPGNDSADALNEIAAGLEAATSTSLEDLLMAAEPEAAEAPAADFDSTLADYAKVEDLTEFRGEIDDIRAMFEEYQAELEAKEQRIATLETDLSSAKSQAAHAEQLALAQNEVLVEVVRLTDKTDMAESLIVDLSRRVASLEVTDPADRVAVERNFERLDTIVKGLSRDVGMVARVAINGSPVALPSASASASTGAGSDAVYAESGRVNGLPSAARAENVPNNVKKGDFVEGYGKVLDIIPTSDGGTLIVMENGSVIK